MQPNTQRFKKLMARERKLMLSGKGAFRDAKRQLKDDEADDFYQRFKAKPKRKHRRRQGHRDRWADDNAEMLYNRSTKRKGKRR